MREPDNAYLRDTIYRVPEGGWVLTYRRTPPGQPMVPDLLRRGDCIEVRRTMCQTPRVDFFAVSSVFGPYHYADPGPDYPCFSVVLMGEKGKSSGHINECVAVDGVVRGLFMANDMEMRVVGRDGKPIAEPPHRKPFQLDLFATEAA